MKSLLERVVRYYFKRYHSDKMADIFLPSTGEGLITPNIKLGWFKFGDIVVNHTGDSYMYLGGCEYLKVSR